MQSFELKNGTIKVIKMAGDADGRGAEAIRKSFETADLYSEILIDFSDVIYIGSRFIRFLAELRKSRPADYGKVKLLNPNDLVRNILALNRVDDIYEIQNIFPTAW